MDLSTVTSARPSLRARFTQRARPRWSRRRSFTFYAFIAPWLIGFLVLTLVPLLYALIVSFTNFDGLSGRWHVIGFANYLELLHDPDTLFSLGRTALFTAITVPVSLAAGLGLAMLLNQRLRAVGVFRTLFYLPSVVPIVASAIMWKLIFDRDGGALNAFLERFGGHTITWLIDPTVFGALIVLALWGLGGGMVIMLAGLQGIPTDVQEAAHVDGANGWQTFWHVTLPLLSPIILFQLVTGVIAALQVFAPALLLSGGQNTNGGVTVSDVPRSNYLYMIHVYSQFFAFQRFGYGSALLWVLFAVVLLATLVILRSGNAWVFYNVDTEGR